MVRLVGIVGIALVILGLITQPMAVAVPVSTTNDTHSIMDLDTPVKAHAGHRITNTVEQLSKAPCHKKTAGTALSERCDNCDSDCINGLCASTCVVSGSAAAHQASTNFDLRGGSLVIAISGAYAYGLPSRIFHPPKHS